MRRLLATSSIVLAAALSAMPALSGSVPTFTDITAGLTGVSGAATAWGDYDGDGDLDLLVTGRTFASTKIARIYTNTGGVFSDSGLLPASAQTSEGAVAFGDYDNDGDLDVAIAGTNVSFTRVTKIYRNDVSAFNDISAPLTGIDDGQLEWVDFDNDGDLDLAVIGDMGGGDGFCDIYANNGGVFSATGSGLDAYRGAAIAFGDHDNDGDLDVVLSGNNASFTPSVNFYRNEGGTFFPHPHPFPGVRDGDFDWGDYDNDGDLDLLMAGGTNSGPITEIFENLGGSFLDIDAGLQATSLCTVQWGDANNDGLLDCVVGGNSASIGFTIVYQQAAFGFFDVNANLPIEWPVAAAWGDYNNDGDLDLSYHAFGFSRIYRNDGVPANTPPAAPTGLLQSSDPLTLTFQWNAATDAEGGSDGLSYNLRIGKTPGGSEIMSPMANSSTGFRRVPRLGNVGQVLQWSISKSEVGTGPIYWSVQAIDQAFAGSPWATEQAGILGVGDRLEGGLSLRMQGPNPFRTHARIAYSLSRAADVDLAVYDVTGRRIAELDAGPREAGDHVVRWSGDRAAAGLYFARLRTGQAATLLRLLKLE